MTDQDQILGRLARSAFRSRFRLGRKQRRYADARGRETVAAHARDFIAARLAPVEPPNDGRQTPMRGHPVFIAQHATACCCRSCLQKWHGIPRGRALDAAQQAQIVDLLMAWIDREMGFRPPPPPARPAE
ncbi:DUF4186 domain-containing protein [Paracoccus sp. P2]|uniref:DUF4186 domain-containing protein n=1 Tax=Paracoccus pantotrophus TaxID=82367 RepID=A0AAE6TW26_PARPN|nr:DUF4186 domain-containing protein [Paracoccus pantotrophus]QFG36450.1 DUF4186 domain-containing protein [Paracoccus pantotrophus]RDD98270.1 DUF4186 domain-containing protein [Paracoccus pantotrophus]RKS42963.1 uncharacterized protein DUF4186 [Paracoccus pantotrophus]WGR66279.1 DUF4186 domain-containing protein [Paracoccus pantotrophus]